MPSVDDVSGEVQLAALREIAEMEDSLSGQIESYQDLLELSRAKRDAVLRWEVTRLDEIIKREEALLCRVASLEEGRLSLQRRIASHVGICPEDLTIEKVIEGLPCEDSRRWRELAHRLREILNELKTVNDLNRELLQRSLSYIRFFLGMLGLDREEPHILLDRQV